MKPAIRTWPGLALAALPLAAGAAGFQLVEQNASGLGNAYAGQAAAAEDASTIHFNPAGMTRLGGRQFMGAVLLIDSSARFRDTGSCAPYVAACGDGVLGHPLGGTNGDAGGLSPVPNLYLSWELVPQRWWVGVGVNAPFGLKTDWDRDWMGRFHALKSEVKTLDINPSVAFKVSDMLSLGGGISARQMKAELSNAVSYYAAALGTGNTALIAAVPVGSEGVATISGDDWGWGWNLGAMVNLGDGSRIGLAWRSPVKFKLDGDVKFSDRPAALATGLPDGNVTADVKLPAVWSVAFSHPLSDRLQLLFDYTRTQWNVIPSLDVVRTSGTPLSSVPMHLKNSWRAGLGLNWRWNDAWLLRAGVAHDTAPVVDEFRTPRLPDSNRNWLALGAQWRVRSDLVADFGYAYLRFDDGSSNLPNQASATSLPQGSLVGRYSSHANILGAQLRYQF